MLRINKASEYGVLALGYIGNQAVVASSAREIADGLRLPYEITAKTLQRLKEAGFIESTMGTHGGYKLKKTLNQISFAQLVDALEGPVALVECTSHRGGSDCVRTGGCGMKNGMQKLNTRLRDLLESVKLDEIIDLKMSAPELVTVENKTS